MHEVEQNGLLPFIFIHSKSFTGYLHKNFRGLNIWKYKTPKVIPTEDFSLKAKDKGQIKRVPAECGESHTPASHTSSVSLFWHWPSGYTQRILAYWSLKREISSADIYTLLVMG